MSLRVTQNVGHQVVAGRNRGRGDRSRVADQERRRGCGNLVLSEDREAVGRLAVASKGHGDRSTPNAHWCATHHHLQRARGSDGRAGREAGVVVGRTPRKLIRG